MPYKKTGRKAGRPPKNIEAFDGKKPTLPDYQWKALTAELRGYSGDFDGWPSTTPVQTVASAAGKSRQTIYAWRKNQMYLRGLHYLLAMRMTENINTRDTDEKHEDNLATSSDRQRDVDLWTFAKDTWQGPTTCSLDPPEAAGTVYQTLDEYFERLKELKAVPAKRRV